MANSITLPKGHSSEYFGEQRNYWWNEDYLRFLLEKHSFTEMRTALEMGCGIGHWCNLLVRILPNITSFTGIDSEECWIKHLERQKNIDNKMTFLHQNALSTSFIDNSFDIVTCQTALQHIGESDKVVKEMLRVLKPGGKLLIVEPVSLQRPRIYQLSNLDHSPEDILNIFKLQIYCERGKNLLGKGNNSIGEQVPQLIEQNGGKMIAAYLNNKVRLYVAPCDSEEEQSYISQAKKWLEDEFWIWDKKSTKRYFLAGGGDLSHFETLWKKALDQYEYYLNKVKLQDLTYASANPTYILIATKEK